MEDLNNAAHLTLLLIGVWLAAPPLVAARKGYPAAPWICALGLIGVVALSFFPRLGGKEPADEQARLRVRAEKLGWGLSAVGFVGWLGFCFLVSGAGGKRLSAYFPSLQALPPICHFHLNPPPFRTKLLYAAESRGTTRERGTHRERRETLPGAQVSHAHRGTFRP